MNGKAKEIVVKSTSGIEIYKINKERHVDSIEREWDCRPPTIDTWVVGSMKKRSEADNTHYAHSLSKRLTRGYSLVTVDGDHFHFPGKIISVSYL
jgi:hypothetical protein